MAVAHAVAQEFQDIGLANFRDRSPPIRTCRTRLPVCSRFYVLRDPCRPLSQVVSWPKRERVRCSSPLFICQLVPMCRRTEVAVGLSISLTGKFHPQGQEALQGIRLWQSYLNAQGGIPVRDGEKRVVRLIWYDDRSQISCARKNVLRLLREDQVDILYGPYSS